MRSKLTALRKLLAKLARQFDPLADVCPNCRLPTEDLEITVVAGQSEPEPPPARPCLWPGRCKQEHVPRQLVIYLYQYPDDDDPDALPHGTVETWEDAWNRRVASRPSPGVGRSGTDAGDPPAGELAGNTAASTGTGGPH